MRLRERVGLIGCGNMGSAILKAALARKIISRERVRVYDVISSKAKVLAKEVSVQVAASEEEAVSKTDVILLAVKPQDFSVVSGNIKGGLHSNKTLVSILAGMSVAKLKTSANGAQVVRAMPNLAAVVGESITAITGSGGRALRIAEEIFSSCGLVVKLPEKFFDLVTAVSGSGPAYFFLMMELLAEVGRKEGLSESTARELAVQTAVGAAKLARESVLPPAELRRKVTSKKGTTEAALKYLQARKFPTVFKGAVLKAMKRSRELSRGR